MRETAKELDWHLNYAGIARIWRGGCIIKVRTGRAPVTSSDLLIALQSVFLGDITSAYEKNPALESLLFDGFFKKGNLFQALNLVDPQLNWFLSCPQGTARLATHYCSGRALGNPHPGIQHSPCLLRRLPQ